MRKIMPLMLVASLLSASASAAAVENTDAASVFEQGPIAFTAVDELPGVADEVSGVVSSNQWVVRVNHKVGSDAFYWDGQLLRVIVRDGGGNAATTAVSSPAHFAVEALMELRLSARSSGSVDVIPGKRSLNIESQPGSDSDLARQATAFLKEFDAVQANESSLHVDPDGNATNIAEPSPGGLQVMAGTSGYTDRWVLDLYGYLCVYSYSYRDLSRNNYWYSSSTAHGSCYYVGVAANGNSEAYWDVGCDFLGILLATGPYQNPRSVVQTAWPTGGYGLDSPACSNHVGWNSNWSQIAPWEGLNAWMP